MSEVLGTPSVERQGFEPLLLLEGVTKSYDGWSKALDDVCLSMRRGEFVSIIGSSGAGKSTLLRCVNRLIDPSQGSVVFDGREVTRERGRALRQTRRRISMVFQHYNLFPHMRVLDNVTLAARQVLRTSRGDAERTGLALLDRIGLAEKAREYPDRLSGGQQQRVAIARAIATDPELLLLDEITSALDPQLVGEVLDLVRDLKAQGATIVMATHEMSFARRVADRVVYLKDGRLIEQGPPEQIFSHPSHPRTRAFLSRVL